MVAVELSSGSGGEQMILRRSAGPAKDLTNVCGQPLVEPSDSGSSGSRGEHTKVRFLETIEGALRASVSYK